MNIIKNCIITTLKYVEYIPICLLCVIILVAPFIIEKSPLDASKSSKATVILYDCNGNVTKKWEASRIYRDGYDESPWFCFRDIKGTKRIIIGTMEIEFYE